MSERWCEQHESRNPCADCGDEALTREAELRRERVDDLLDIIASGLGCTPYLDGGAIRKAEAALDELRGARLDLHLSRIGEETELECISDVVTGARPVEDFEPASGVLGQVIVVLRREADILAESDSSRTGALRNIERATALEKAMRGLTYRWRSKAMSLEEANYMDAANCLYGCAAELDAALTGGTAPPAPPAEELGRYLIPNQWPSKPPARDGDLQNRLEGMTRSRDKWRAKYEALTAAIVRAGGLPKPVRRHEHQWSKNGCVCVVCGTTAQQLATTPPTAPPPPDPKDSL